VAGLSEPVTAGGPPSRPACAVVGRGGPPIPQQPGAVRRPTAASPGWQSRWLSVARGGRGSRGSPWFPLRFNQLKGVRWRGRLLGPGAPSQSSGPPEPGVSTTFWLLS
jgi:hypothetical protein